ncbi:MAG TPA: hypothetical protein VLB82_11675 [Thermodesulfobacteriota bacterium]|nr:hypothetical protein [Thermodesulfobacteriota bacterium]
MKLHTDFTINGKHYPKGSEYNGKFIYAFFLFHMAMFGGSGFLMAYNSNVELSFLYMHGGFAILIYTIFYFAIFGFDTVKWMFINAGLGLFGIYAEINWLLSLFGKQASDFPRKVHVIPFLYYVLYTFLIRQAVLDFVGVRDDPERTKKTNIWYVIVSLVIYSIIYIIQK